MNSPKTLFSMFSVMGKEDKNFVTYILRQNRKKNALTLWQLILSNNARNWPDIESEYLKFYPRTTHIQNIISTIENAIFEGWTRPRKISHRYKLNKMINHVEILLQKGLKQIARRIIANATKTAEKYEYFEELKRLATLEFLADEKQDETATVRRDRKTTAAIEKASNLFRWETILIGYQAGQPRTWKDMKTLSCRAMIASFRCNIWDSEGSAKARLLAIEQLIAYYNIHDHFLNDPDDREIFSKALHGKSVLLVSAGNLKAAAGALVRLENLDNVLDPRKQRLRIAGAKIHLFTLQRNKAAMIKELKAVKAILEFAGTNQTIKTNFLLMVSLSLFYFSENDQASMYLSRLTSYQIRGVSAISYGLLLLLICLSIHDPGDTFPEVAKSIQKRLKYAGQLNPFTQFIIDQTRAIKRNPQTFDFVECLRDLQKIDIPNEFRNFEVFDHYLRGKIENRSPIEFL